MNLHYCTLCSTSSFILSSHFASLDIVLPAATLRVIDLLILFPAPECAIVYAPGSPKISPECARCDSKRTPALCICPSEKPLRLDAFVGAVASAFVRDSGRGRPLPGDGRTSSHLISAACAKRQDAPGRAEALSLRKAHRLMRSNVRAVPSACLRLPHLMAFHNVRGERNRDPHHYAAGTGKM